MPRTYSISGVRIVTPQGPVEDSPIEVKGKRIGRLGFKCRDDLCLDSNLIVFPALINVHDHLRGTYLPRVGPPSGEFYLKCSNWEKDLRRSMVLKERSKLSQEDCYYLGGYKNVLSGVVTVNDHYPHEENEPIIPLLPLRVIRNYTLAHEASSYSLDWGEGIEIEHRRARKYDYPFIIHMEEGFDEEYQRGIELLEGYKCLDEHSVLIHCLGFSEKDIRKVKRQGCTVVWCPSSNFFMFNVTCKIKKILKAGINCALGTDSTHTGSINLLEEIRFAREMYKKMYGEVLDSKIIFDMVTINAARAFRMEKDIGSIEESKFADFIVLRPRHDDPYEALVQTQIEDIELLTWEGEPVYGARRYRDFFKLDDRKYTDIRIRGQDKFVSGDPAGLLRRVREKVGFKKKLDFLPLDDD
jgi:5-methylthioadenosine/S-adenosylhomocysteine deaminase